MSATVLAHRPRSIHAARSRRSAHTLARATARTKTRTGWASAGPWVSAGTSALAPVPDRPRLRAVQPATVPETQAPASAPRVADVLAPAAPPAPRLRLTRRGRVAVAVSATAVTVLLSLTLVPAVAAGVASTFSPSPASSTTVVVQPGQSLWQVAQATAPNGDTASMVARIADANGITSADQLRPGQRLEVPLS